MKKKRSMELEELSEFRVIEEKIEWSESSENYDIESFYENEKNEELIRIEMNTIEFPFFTKNKKIGKNTIMTYEFNNLKNKYLKIRPLAGNKIPGEFEEKIFFALLKLYKRNGHNQTIFTDFATLIHEMNLEYSGNVKNLVKKGLKLLGGTNYEFNNLFYSNEARKILSDNIFTNIFSIRIIQLSEAEESNNPETLKWFRNSKIKEIIQIKFSGHFFDNVIRKGYLYFDRQDLLQIENPVSRTLYMMLTKWRNKELYVKRYSKFLAGRIPLSWKKNNLTGSIKILTQAFEELKNQNIIKNYRLNSKDGRENSYFEIWFDESHNKNYFRKTDMDTLGDENSENFQITSQRKENILEVEKIEDDISLINSEITKQTRELMNLLPDKAKSLTTMEGKVEKAIKKYGYLYTKGAVLYTKSNAKASFGKYFDGTLSQNWHEEFMLGLKEQEEKELAIKEKRAKTEEKEAQLNFETSEAEKRKEEMKARFLSLPLEEQERVGKIVYTDYIAEAGGRATKAVTSAFERARLALIGKYLEEVRYFENVITEAEIVEEASQFKKSSKMIQKEKVVEILPVEPIPQEQDKRRDMSSLLGGLMGAFSTEGNSVKRVEIPVAEIVKPAEVEEEKIAEVIVKKAEEKNENIVTIEKEYQDLMMFKFDIFGCLNNKMNLDILKNIMDFMNIESHFKGEIQNYKLDFKFVQGGKSLIYIEKLS